MQSRDSRKLGGNVVKVEVDRSRRVDLKELADELMLMKLDGALPGEAPARADVYPLTLMESAILIRAFSRWMQFAGPDGVFVEGYHGRSLDLLAEEEIFAPQSTLVQVEWGRPAKYWRFLYQGTEFQKLQRQKILGDSIAQFPSGPVAEVIAQNTTELVAAGEPAVTRISGFSPRGFLCYDRLFLPIANETGEIYRFVTVSNPVVRVLDV